MIMDVESSLLAGIAAHPHDDTPRLVYADWLDENGHSLRAEFIRVQCAVKHLEQLPGEKQRPHIHLWRRNQELLDQHRHDLLGPLGKVVGYFDAVFDRGFLSELTLTAARFLKFVAAIRTFRPRPRIRVHTVRPAEFYPVLNCPELALVESLNLSAANYDDEPLREEGSAAIARCPNLTRLEVLELEGCEIGDGGLFDLAQAATLPALIELDVSYNAISDEGVRQLVRSPLWPRLRRLVLGGNPLSSDSALTLALAASTSRLENLNLRFTGIGPDGHGLLLEQYGGRVDLF